jgi:ATP-binding cassette, subfamily C (CFTR/MRP), member 1
MSLANAITLRTHIIKSQDKSTNLEAYIFYVYYALILVNLILSTISEKYFEEKSHGSVQSNVNLLSFVTFWWSNYLISVGYKRDLTHEDLYEIEHRHKSKAIIEKVDNEWTKKKLIYFKKLNQLNDVGFISKTKRKEVVPDEPSLSICLVKLFGTQFIGTICIRITSDLLSYAQPLFIDKLINFIKDKEQKSNIIGFFYIFILFVTSFSKTLITLHYQYGDFIIGQQMKIGMQNLIFRKSLKLSSSARKETTVGEMVII